MSCPRHIRVGACADYLVGVKIDVIEKRWGVSHVTILEWIRKAGFKLRSDAGHSRMSTVIGNDRLADKAA